MDANRTQKISVNLTPDLLRRLDDLATNRRWTRSTAAAVLIELGLDTEDRRTAVTSKAATRTDYAELAKQYLDFDRDELGEGEDR